MEACQKEDEMINQSGSSVDSNLELKSRMLNTFYGPTVPIGKGVARAWVSVNQEGNPTSVGINLSEKALERECLLKFRGHFHDQ